MEELERKKLVEKIKQELQEKRNEIKKKEERIIELRIKFSELTKGLKEAKEAFNLAEDSFYAFRREVGSTNPEILNEIDRGIKCLLE